MGKFGWGRVMTLTREDVLKHKIQDTFKPAWKPVMETYLTLLEKDQLERLLWALENDDSRLVQGATTSPPPLQCVQDWPVEACCFVSYPGSDFGPDDDPDEVGGKTVAEVEEFFASMCFAIDQKMGEPAACRWLLNWFDDTPRETVIQLSIPVVKAEIEKRKTKGEDVEPVVVTSE